MNGVFGKAGTGLQDASWAVNADVARIGAAGEAKTQALLDVFGKQAGVFHDLRVPIPGFKANMDHVIVSGRKVLIIDTKVWQPGFHWTWAGANRRGLKRVSHTEKDQAWVTKAMTKYLDGTGANVWDVRIAVWPSRPGKVGTAFLKVPGAVVLPAENVGALVSKFIGVSPANDAITSRLMRLITAAPKLGRAAGYSNEGF